MKQIIIVTHGDKFSGANPSMTEKGFEQIKALRPLLPDNLANVACGTGRRHGDVAKALGLTPNRYSSVFGDGESMEKVGDVYMVILTDGTKLPMQAHTTLFSKTGIIDEPKAYSVTRFLHCQNTISTFLLYPYSHPPPPNRHHAKHW
ncbi:MAG: hypothetical protein WC639_03020 [Patescibacteria group bacterium]|jgi:hypothetical protein